MPDRSRLVVDTNVVISGLLFPGSDLGRAWLKAQTREMLASEATKLEFVEVMSRSKFDRYVALEIRQQLMAEYIHACETVLVHSIIRASRDPKDDKFLELAVDGRANLILTGDQDLLALHPFRGIAIITLVQYLLED